MASFTGITAAKADEVLGMSVISGTINGSGHLILSRDNGDEIDAGDFTAIVGDILADQVTAAIQAQLPNYIAGTVQDKGDISGVVTFTAFNSANLPNAMIKARLVGNITIDVANLPSTPKPNTQFAMKLVQDGTGGRTLTLTGFKKTQGILSLTTAANAIDLLVFIYDGAQWYAGMMGADMK